MNNDFVSVNTALLICGFQNQDHRIYLMGQEGLNNLYTFRSMTNKDISNIADRIARVPVAHGGFNISPFYNSIFLALLSSAG